MHRRLEQTFYVLASAVLAVGFFVVSNSQLPEVQAYKSQLRQEFVVAFEQTIGDGPVFDDVFLVINGINDFYAQASDAVIALLSQPETDEDMIYVFGSVYQTFAKAFVDPSADQPAVAGVEIVILENFMQEEPIYSIMPESHIFPAEEAASAASQVSSTQPYMPEFVEGEIANTDLPWVTLKDNVTGEFYCTAIYNGEVSTYQGKCKNDYY